MDNHQTNSNQLQKASLPPKLQQIAQVFEYYATHHGPDGKKPNRAQRRAAAFGIKCGKNTAGKGKKNNGINKRQRMTIE